MSQSQNPKRQKREAKFVDDRDRDNQPPVHRRTRTNGAKSAFLEWVGHLDRDPDLSDLPDLYTEWQRRTDDGEQTTLGGDGR